MVIKINSEEGEGGVMMLDEYCPWWDTQREVFQLLELALLLQPNLIQFIVLPRGLLVEECTSDSRSSSSRVFPD